MSDDQEVAEGSEPAEAGFTGPPRLEAEISGADLANGFAGSGFSEPAEEVLAFDRATEPLVEPAVGVFEAAIADEFEVFTELCEETLKSAETVNASALDNFQHLTSEAMAFAKCSLERRAAFSKVLLATPSWGSAVQIQTSYARSEAARFVAHAMNMSALLLKLMSDACDLQTNRAAT